MANISSRQSRRFLLRSVSFELFRGKNAENTRKFYPNTTQLIEDIAQAYRTFFQEIYAAGCRTVQLDDCTWGMIVDSDYWKAKVGNGFTLGRKPCNIWRWTILPSRANRRVDHQHPRMPWQLSFLLCHQGCLRCRSSLSFAHEDVDTFYLEYDDERSGGFEPLKYVADGKKVVLGLVTSNLRCWKIRLRSSPRIREAARYIPLDRLSLSPQCGFASCRLVINWPMLSKWAKIDLVRDFKKFGIMIYSGEDVLSPMAAHLLFIYFIKNVWCFHELLVTLAKIKNIIH